MPIQCNVMYVYLTNLLTQSGLDIESLLKEKKRCIVVEVHEEFFNIKPREKILECSQTK